MDREASQRLTWSISSAGNFSIVIGDGEGEGDSNQDGLEMPRLLFPLPFSDADSQ